MGSNLMNTQGLQRFALSHQVVDEEPTEKVEQTIQPIIKKKEPAAEKEELVPYQSHYLRGARYLDSQTISGNVFDAEIEAPYKQVLSPLQY